MDVTTSNPSNSTCKNRAFFEIYHAFKLKNKAVNNRVLLLWLLIRVKKVGIVKCAFQEHESQKRNKLFEKEKVTRYLMCTAYGLS